jgi:hypothetical protein
MPTNGFGTTRVESPQAGQRTMKSDDAVVTVPPPTVHHGAPPLPAPDVGEGVGVDALPDLR